MSTEHTVIMGLTALMRRFATPRLCWSLVAPVFQMSAFECHLPAQTAFSQFCLIHRLVAERLGRGGRYNRRKNQGEHDQVVTTRTP